MQFYGRSKRCLFLNRPLSLQKVIYVCNYVSIAFTPLADTYKCVCVCVCVPCVRACVCGVFVSIAYKSFHWLIKRACVCVCGGVCGGGGVTVFFCSLLCNELCAPIWRHTEFLCSVMGYVI